MDSSWPVSTVPCFFPSKRISPVFSTFFPLFLQLIFSCVISRTDLLILSLQCCLSYILSLLTLDGSSRSTCNTQLRCHSTQMLHIALPNRMFFPMSCQEYNISFNSIKPFLLTSICFWKKKVIKRQLTYFLFFFILLLCDLPFQFVYISLKGFNNTFTFFYIYTYCLGEKHKICSHWAKI